MKLKDYNEESDSDTPCWVGMKCVLGRFFAGEWIQRKVNLQERVVSMVLGIPPVVLEVDRIVCSDL